MTTTDIKLPPWTKKRRLFTTLILTGFILFASGFIGFGMYTIAVQRGVILPPVSTKTILNSLLHDVQFLKATTHSARKKYCENTTIRLRLHYEAPLHPATLSGPEACLTFSTTHPTGTKTVLTIERRQQSRADAVVELAKSFSTIQTDLLAGTHYPTSRLMGLKHTVTTVGYVLETSSTESVVVMYGPTSQVFDGKILSLVESLESF